MNVYLASQSELKYRTLRRAVEYVSARGLIFTPWEIHSQAVDSKVPSTPHGDQTFEGAQHRARTLYDYHQGHGLFIGIESGLIERHGRLFEECWTVLVDEDGKESSVYSSGLALPSGITARLAQGDLHVDIMNELAQQHGIDSKDTWGLYTKSHLSREEGMYESIRNALLSYALASQ